VIENEVKNNDDEDMSFFFPIERQQVFIKRGIVNSNFKTIRIMRRRSAHNLPPSRFFVKYLGRRFLDIGHPNQI
jgi:hypothetical protein